MSDKCTECNGTGHKGGLNPLDFRDHPDAGRLVFEKCYLCGGNGKGGEYAYVELDDMSIERRGGVWRPCGGTLKMSDAVVQAKNALDVAERRAKLLREALLHWGVNA